MYNKMNPIVPIAGGMMLCCLSSSVASFMTGGEEDPGAGGAGGAGGAAPSAGGAGTPSYPDHPLHGDKFLVRAAPFTGDILPAIIPDPSNENLLTFEQNEPK